MIKPYYEEKGITIYHGDCREILPELEPVDLVLTSPPYDNLRDYGGHGFDWKSTIDAIIPVMLPGGVCVWVVGDATIDGSETGTSFKQALYFLNKGLKLHDTMIYEKNSPPLTHRRYEQYFEYMFVISKDIPKTFNPLEDIKLYRDNRKIKAVRRERDGSSDLGFASQKTTKIRGNVWRYKIGGGHVTKDKVAYDHPAIFPEALAHDHIYSWTNTNNTVLDPMCGSGTTLKISKQLNRKAIGIEIEEKYCEIAVKRLAQGVLDFVS